MQRRNVIRAAVSCAAMCTAAASLGACSTASEADAVEETPGTATTSAELGRRHGGHGRHRNHRRNILPGHNLHLEKEVRFVPVPDGADADSGRQLFGLAADLETEDKTGALFEGPSVVYGGPVVSNQRTCASCHRGKSNNLGLPALPLTDSVDPDDALLTGFEADAQGDPDALQNLTQLGLVKYRPGRFNPARSADDPFREVFFWRKVTKLVNTGLQVGFLNDGRARVMFETARGAMFAHTQTTDNRFDDIISPSDINDMDAFQVEATFSDPRLAALRDPSHPDYEALTEDPFYTVPISTWRQRRGARVFRRNCMSCHSTPNVFNDSWNVKALGDDARTVTDPAFGPAVGRAFNIGVAERNAHGLRFSVPRSDGSFETIVMQLANEDGSTASVPVTFDIGLAGTTGRTVDVGRFKVPQLRNLTELAPYFHDNSAATLEEVVDYFNSPAYNHSRDGRRYPIHLSHRERRDLLAFLRIL